jgi:hypothetical protein
MYYSISVCLLIISCSVRAYGQRDAGDTPLSQRKMISLTLSPVSLLEPLFHLTAEFPSEKRTSAISIVLGIGYVGNSTAYVMGAQGSLYPVGRFEHGMQVGAQIIYADFGSEATPRQFDAGMSMGVGGFLGYKRVLLGGLTLQIQGGAQLRFVLRTLVNDSASGDKEVTKEHMWGAVPLLNTGIGWSF